MSQQTQRQMQIQNPQIKDLERIIKKTKISNKLIDEQLDFIIREIEDAKIRNDYSQLSEKLQNQKPLSQIKQQNKECYQYISKMGKNMDKLYKKNLQYGQESIELNQSIVNELIQTHLLRQGEFDVYKTLIQESGQEESILYQFFCNVKKIIDDLKNKNLESAILWAISNNENELLFQLMKQRFIQIVQQQGSFAAIQYIRENQEFQKFVKERMFEVCQMTTSLAFVPEVAHSKYEHLYKESNWNNLLNLFIEVACKSQNILNTSEIKVIFTAGLLALPKLIKYNQVTKNRSSEIITNDIPIEIEIGKEYKYHSFFVCPVSREITKPDNPPVLLKCGHVISKHSADKMTQNKTRFKCPTCPQEQKLSDLRELVFN